MIDEVIRSLNSGKEATVYLVRSGAHRRCAKVYRDMAQRPSESALTSPNPFLSGAAYLPLAHIAAYNYFDLNGTIDLSKNFTVRLGVNNVADKAPPLVFGYDCTGTPGGLCSGNTFPGVYDALGRYLFMNVSAQWCGAVGGRLQAPTLCFGVTQSPRDC